MEWINKMYDVDLLDDTSLNQFYETIKYIGFNRQEVLIEIKKVFPDHKIAAQAIIVCALRGPKKASELKLGNGRTLREMGVPASGLKGKNGLSCARIGAATADLAAFYLKRLGVSKRLDLPLPAWLQFPTAGSIKLPQEYREMHREFSKRFSPQIQGDFNESIYESMVANAYLDERLKLF